MSQLSAIIIGANAGLSQTLARKLAAEGVRLGLLAADRPALQPLLDQLPDTTLCNEIDIFDPDQCRQALDQLWQQLEGAQLVIINTAANHQDLDLPWLADKMVVDVNVTGFTALANAAFARFRQQKYGQLAAITSIAGERGGASSAFHASKAYQQNYLQGLRLHAQRLKLPVTVSDLRLGYIDKMQARGSKTWGASLEVVADQILANLKKAKATSYVTRRWRLVSWIGRLLPEFIYNKRKYR
ncbi:SDR family NAD(P)-dependent oxidoreductase [Ferrimonas sediminicola]|uniref:SDR family NAD(P)-dependent oxidoreductase n=1 Tax=Ferrimonas sediminicola TaxID=2569538 RepID=A0A4U1BIB0_9GAMM|nr:SDR family NAD(P)-dependent oxidoreductase [Ferrimonas sediminicola]TKB49786.1 SDR family NAD(P)-dependent oxidoreductase [Ferrimonas sediminicola]